MTCACQSCNCSENYSEPQSEEEEEEVEEGSDEETETIEENDNESDEETIEENECEAYQPGVAGYDDSVGRCRDHDGRFISCDDIGC